jgi:hypothetical protein
MVDDRDSDGETPEAPRPDSLLPYDEWTETALRQVMVRAIEYAAEHGLPGDHHFYLTFRTDHPGTVVPGRLRTQYPQEMTIVLQHQFWNLGVDHAAGTIGVGLSFGGVPATLVIPLAAVTAFADPHVQYGLRFRPEQPAAAPAAITATPPEAAAEPAEGPAPDPTPQVVSLDAFRRRPPARE